MSSSLIELEAEEDNRLFASPSPELIEPEYVPYSPRSPGPSTWSSSVASLSDIDEFGPHFRRGSTEGGEGFRGHSTRQDELSSKPSRGRVAKPPRCSRSLPKPRAVVGASQKPPLPPLRSGPVWTGITGPKDSSQSTNYSCEPCKFGLECPNSFHLHLLSDRHFNTFGVRGLVLYCTFCKHFAVHAHNFKTHLCSKRHVRNVLSRKGLRYA